MPSTDPIAEAGGEKPTPLKQKLKGALNLFFTFYMISMSIAVPYFNWQYARENGFLKWIALGLIVPTAKSFVWPYYAFHGSGRSSEDPKPLSQQQINQMQMASMVNALNAGQQASFVSNTLSLYREPGAPVDQKQLDRMVEYSVQAIQSANSTDEGTLNSIYPELGTRFKKHFVEGTRMFISGVRNRSREDVLKSKELDDLWSDWFRANRNGINEAYDKAIR